MPLNFLDTDGIEKEILNDKNLANKLNDLTVNFQDFFENSDALESPNAESSGYFGYSVSISDNYAIVGANYEDAQALNNSGKAYIFEKNIDGTFNTAPVATLESGNAELSGYFGNSVAITDNYAIVGARQEGVQALSGSGRAYIFENSGGTWNTTPVAVLESANVESGGNFGYSVAMSDSYAIVGARSEDAQATTYSGRAYIFENVAGAWNTTPIAVLESANVESSGNFGYSVAMSDNYAIVGAWKEDAQATSDSGRAYIFENSGGTWNTTPVATLESSNRKSNGYFGNSVAITDNYAIVGAYYENAQALTSGRAYIFENNAGVWNTTAVAELQSGNAEVAGIFGSSVAISDNYAIVSAISEDGQEIDGSGKAYIFENVEGVWNLTPYATLESPNAESGGNFGHSVSITDSYAIVGALYEDAQALNNSGRAYLIRNNLTINGSFIGQNRYIGSTNKFSKWNGTSWVDLN